MHPVVPGLHQRIYKDLQHQSRRLHTTRTPVDVLQVRETKFFYKIKNENKTQN